MPAFAGAAGLCSSYRCSNRFAALSEGGCQCHLLEADSEAALLPLQEGAPKMKPEFDGYVKVQLAIDSGAAASVMPERLLHGHTVVAGEAAQRGTHYLAADGGRIPNLGETELGFVTKEKHRCRIKFQVAAVKRPLLAVSTLTKAGNDVLFNSDGGTITNRSTKRVIHFRKSDGIYVLDVLMAPGRAGATPAKSAPADGGGEWKQVQSKRTAWRTQQPLKSVGSGSAPGSGFARQGAQD